MANPEHLDVLQEGCLKWNAWRSENTKVFPDLSGADLRGRFLDEADFRQATLAKADLTGIHAKSALFSGADLSGATLSEAYLPDAKFAEADLSSANLSHANLYAADLANVLATQTVFKQTTLMDALFVKANLENTDFTNANLDGSNFTLANLRRANFQQAHLKNANLTRAVLDESYFDLAILGRTLLIDTNLSEVLGLDSCIHIGPSPIDLATLARSGELPLSFLRGCGLSDNFIDYLPSLLNEPFQFYSCFISYSSNDTAFAQRLYADLQNTGVRCWYAPEDMKIGDRIRDRIDQSIRVYDKLLLILSRNSIGSAWVEKEVETAFEEERRRDTTVLFPIRLDEDVMETDRAWAADIRRTRHIGDFASWKDHDSYTKAFSRLLRDLRGIGTGDMEPVILSGDSEDEDDIPF